MLFLLSACSAGQEEGRGLTWEKIPTAGPAVVQEEEYQEIYRQVVTQQEGGGLTFSLIYLDEDEIPELVVCDGGYGVYSIYSVKEGAAFCMVKAMNTVELSYFERSGIISRFQRWNGGGDEGGYGMDFYRVSGDQTLTDGDAPILRYSYDASEQEGAGTEEGVTKYYDRDQEIDEPAYRLKMEELGIAQGAERPVTENACQRQEMLERLGGEREETQAGDQSPLEGRILDQSFPAELDGFGKVVFSPFDPISYPSENPDYGTTMFGDVRFMLLSSESGEKIYDFPGETKDNILSGFNRFNQVLSVAFRDYNNDGRMDILLILEYEGAGGDIFRKARVYTQKEGEYEFRIDTELSEYLGNYTESMERMWEGIQSFGAKTADSTGEASDESAERFAKEIREEILEGDYESLAQKCVYPIRIDGETFENQEALLASGLLQNPPEAFLDAIRQETCEDMFHNWQGFMLGNGEVWFSEILNEDYSSDGLKIIGFNNIRTEAPERE